MATILRDNFPVQFPLKMSLWRSKYSWLELLGVHVVGREKNKWWASCRVSFPVEIIECPLTIFHVSGDQVSRKGTLTGGYYGLRRSRLEIHRQIVELKEKLETTQGEKDQLRGQIDDILLECIHRISTGDL